MNNTNFTVPYPIGTYLTKNIDGTNHLDQVDKYIIDENGVSVILTLDVETDPRLSIPISVEDLLENWLEDTKHLSSDTETKSNISMHSENGPIKKLNKKD